MTTQTNQTNQVYLYSVNTKAFYNEEEYAKQQEIYELTKIKEDEDVKDQIKTAKWELEELMKNHTGVRVLNSRVLNERNVIAQFQSSFTRSMNLDSNSKNPTTDFMVVEAYHYDVMDSLIANGFTHDDESYRYVFSSAGQIRSKKLIFTKESVYKVIENKLTAGLTDELINSKGGISINKLIAYKALCNSSSFKWEIDIDKAIVVNDFEFTIKDKLVDYIGSDYNVERKVMDVLNPVTDGAGICLPSVYGNNIQFRGTFFKGLLTPFAFDEFITEHNANPIVTDVWGKEWNVIEDDIQIIFTASQFKMWKMFESWENYKENFKKYECEFSICDVEGEVFKDAKLNYQMLQTLWKMPQEDLEEIASYTKATIENATESQENMLEFIGATKDKKFKQPWQKALLMYPELINDAYFKKMIKIKKSALIKDARSGKIIIPNTKRTFLVPDCFAFAQWLFGMEVTGLLVDGQVSCQLYENEQELDVLRSPHLFLEHACRTNLVDEKIKKWFTTNGAYTSIHDAISTQLMFDVDGDTTLLISDKTIIKNAKEHMKNIVPLQYELGVAKKTLINNDTIIDGLKAAFKMDIGEISNTISKIFGQDEITEDDLTTVRLLTYQNNMAIDFAKCLFFAVPPKAIKKKLNKLKDDNLPRFFMQAKDKTSSQVLERNNCTVNKLYDVMITKRLIFSSKAFDYTNLMNNKDVEIDNAIVEKYRELTATRYFKMQEQLSKQGDTPAQVFAIQTVREELLNLDVDKDMMIDMIVKYLHEANSEYKKFLWDCFGEEIIWNMKNNLGKLKTCKCTKKFDPTSNRQVMCDECGKVAKKETAKLRKQKQRDKKVS